MEHNRPIEALYADMRRQWLEAFPKPANLKRTRQIMRDYHDHKASQVAYLKGTHLDRYTM